jgi:hypothetical protein
MDIAVIVSGDGDFAPAIKALQDKGVRCEVISFKPNTSSDLIAVADEFMDIMKVASISRKEGRAIREGMSAPEMPAKEVTPEFGFREASPSVAAAALAALKGGTAEAPRRGRGSGTRRAASPATQPPGEAAVEAVPVAAVPAAAVPAAAVPAAADVAEQANEETRRRRRRRGGRGRGRGRREDEEPAAAGAETASGEIGWEEFDDLAQLDGTEDREYGFAEADAATLAELGLSEEEIAALTAAGEGPDEAPDEAPAGDEEKPKRRSTRSRKAAEPTDEAPAEAPAGDEEKPKRRSTRSRKAAEPTDEASAEGPAGDEEKPKRRSTRSRRAAEPTTNESSALSGDGDAPEGEPQGIWGRFRSARKPRGVAGA